MKLKNSKKFIFFIFLYVNLCLISACKVVTYSFSGTTTDAESIFVGNFLNRAGGGPANIGIDFTERLKEYYQRNTRLEIGERNSDLLVEGNITTYELRPIAATANDQAAQNRLTIGVEIDFTDTRDDEKSFTQVFSFYSDFPQNQTLSQVEQEKIDEIFEQIILDIFNKTVADW